MDILTIGVIGVLMVVLVTTVAPKIGVAAPLILVVVGIVAGSLPMVGAVEIEPEWILGGLLPPLLYSAAVNTPTMEFRRDLGTISIFAVALVIVSAVAVGFLLTWMIPGLPLPLGIAMGAILSPTDAVATTIVRKAGVSPRIVTILEGEALFNDASALVLLRSAVAAISVSVSFAQVALDFLYAVVVALAIGFVIGQLHIIVRSRISQVASSVALSLVIPYLAYVPAEHFHASGLVAAVTAGLVTGYHTPDRLSAEVRISEKAVWSTVELLLENAVFLLMGLQLFTLLGEVHNQSRTELEAVSIGVAATAVVMVIRTFFVSGAVWLLAKRAKKLPQKQERIDKIREWFDQAPDFPISSDGSRQERRIGRFQEMLERQAADLDYLASEKFSWKDGAILITAGMRGAVTLAAAQSLPHDVPFRSLLVLAAFAVAVGTLLLQGGTLSTVVKWLNVTGRDASEDAELLEQLRVELAEATLAELDKGVFKQADGTSFSLEVIIETRKILQTTIDPDEELSEHAVAMRELRLELLESQRAQLRRIRSRGSYPSEILDAKLVQLDTDQIGIELRQ